MLENLLDKVKADSLIDSEDSEDAGAGRRENHLFCRLYSN